MSTLEIIFNEAYRCKDIIQNLLEYSRQPTEGTETLELDQIIKDSVSLVRQHAKDSKIKIIVRNGLAKGFNRILGNESQLKHLFLNVFNNAFRSLDDGGLVTIVSKTAGNLIEIRISHKGSESCGLARLRKPDTRCSDGQSEQSSPMALSVCYSIMRHHHGEMRFESLAGEESALVLRFPVQMG